MAIVILWSVTDVETQQDQESAGGESELQINIVIDIVFL